MDSMNYIEDAKKILGEKIDVEDDLLDLYTLLVFVQGPNTVWRDVHDAWSIWRNKTMPDHRSIVLFDELSEDVKKMDEEYTQAIIETFAELDI